MMKSVFDVVVVGNVGVDTNVYFQQGSIGFEIELNFTENIDDVGQAGEIGAVQREASMEFDFLIRYQWLKRLLTLTGPAMVWRSGF